MEGLGTLGRLGLEGLLLFVYPNLLSSGSIYRLEGGRGVFSSVSSSITYHCRLGLADAIGSIAGSGKVDKTRF